MQKVIQRTAAAKRQAIRRAQIKNQKSAYWKRKERKTEQRYIHKEEHKQVKAARTARREDWELGPLAPKRDIGADSETYGTVDTRLLQGVEIEKNQRRERWDVLDGDRVVVLRGRDKGKIGTVREVQKDKDTVTVRGLNLADIAIPSWMQKAEQDPRPFRTTELPMPYDDVRLVHPVIDPVTSEPRDVILENVQWVRQETVSDDGTTKIRNMRKIPGFDVLIAPPERAKPEHEDHEVDTLRITVDNKTFIPTLLSPPMPDGVINELRNKYGRFRTRHDDEYVARKMAEDEEARLKGQRGALMMTPLQEWHAREREKRRATPKILTDDMLARIGEEVARNQGLDLSQLAEALPENDAAEEATVNPAA